MYSEEPLSFKKARVTGPIVEYTFRGPLHDRIQRHNDFLLRHGAVRGYSVICAGTRAAHYLAQSVIDPDATHSPAKNWTQREADAIVETKPRASRLLTEYTDSALWRFTRIVVIGNTGCLAFDYPTIGGL